MKALVYCGAGKKIKGRKNRQGDTDCLSHLP